MKNKILLLFALLTGATSLSYAELKVDMGICVNNGTYYTFPELTVNGSSGDLGYVIRFMFTRAVTNSDKITLPALPNGWSTTSNSTQHVSVVNIPNGASAADLQAFIRDVQVVFDASKKGQGVAVLISESSSDSNRRIYYSSETDHWYEYVSQKGLSWRSAYNAAIDKTFMGMNGYLVVVTSQKENDFVRTLISNYAWTAGTRLDISGLLDANGKITSDPTKAFNFWYWSAGPEWENGGRTASNCVFYNKKTHDGTPVSVVVKYNYSSWDTGEPNDGGAENCMHFLGSSGLWNDFAQNNTTVEGYIVEFEGNITGAISEGVIGFTNKKDAVVAGVADNGTAAAPVALLLNEVVEYSITGFNTSQTDENVVIRDTLPVGLTLVDGSISNGGIYDHVTREIVWTLTVNHETETQVSFQAKRDAGVSGALTNVAHITSDGTTVLKTNNTYHDAKMFEVLFEAGANGALANDASQQVDYTMHAASGVTPTPDTDYRFVGWSHPDFKDFRTGATVAAASGIMDYTTIPIVNDVKLTAEFAIITYNVAYDGNNQTSGVAPPTVVHDVNTNPALSGNTGDLRKDDACFVGWSAGALPVVVQLADEPADLKKPGNTFLITSDTLFYAVWADDKTGPTAAPDSVPDYLQLKVSYNKGLPAVVGVEPVDSCLYNNGNNAIVLGNIGVPQLTLTDACFIGWSFVQPSDIVTMIGNVPSDIMTAGDNITVNTDTTLYAVWAEDKTGPTGTPDGIPDYEQKSVTYNRSLATAGKAPIDGNKYNIGDIAVVLGNAGIPQMSLADACFIGWSFNKQTNIIATATVIPADLIQPSSTFIINTDSTLYAVWADDKTGPTAAPDSVPDYLQFKVSYDKGLPAVVGVEPVDNLLYNKGNNAIVLDNANIPQMSLTDACFIGWSFVQPSGVVTTAGDVPVDIMASGDNITVNTDTTLYAVWAEDKTGPTGTPDGIPDYEQKSITYNHSLATAGNAPIDGKKYNIGDMAVVLGNAGIPQMSLVDACFIGWSFNKQTNIITTVTGIPVDLIQPSSTFIINTDSTLYAVWADDKTGPTAAPDSIPDYLQFKVSYDRGLPTVSGIEPVDNRLYNKGKNAIVLGNIGAPQLTLTDACFIGWSFIKPSSVATTIGDVPSDIMTAGDNITVSSNVTLYAIWAEDKGGPGGVPDGKPDFDQVKLTYHENALYPSAGGSLPSPNPIILNPGTQVAVKGNTGGLYRAPSDESSFTGWCTTADYPLVRHIADKPVDMLTNGDSIFVGATSVDLYAVWAYDSDGDGVPDYSELDVEAAPNHRWLEKDADDPANPGYNQDKPAWKPEHDEPGEDSWYEGCVVTYTIRTDPDPYTKRTVRLRYLGALTGDLITGVDGRPLADSYILPQNEASLTFHFMLNKIPADLEGQLGALEAEISGGGRDTSAWMRLYNHPSYDNIIVRQYVDADGRIELGISGGSPNLMRSINGLAWRNAYLPLTSSEAFSVGSGVGIWLREPCGCWEDKFFFMTHNTSVVVRAVELPVVAGVTTDPPAGKHPVQGHDDFTFTASYSGTPLKVTARGFYSGKNVELAEQNVGVGVYSYTIRQVVEPWTIAIGPEPSAVVDVPHDAPFAWAYRTTLHIWSASAAVVNIYSMSGALHHSTNVAAGDTLMTLERGAYIVVVGGARFKVVIR